MQIRYTFYWEHILCCLDLNFLVQQDIHKKVQKKSKNAGDLHLIVLKEKEYKNLTLTTHTQTQRTHTKHAIAAKAQTH